eukprot:GHVS01065357.1.p1 GENE.GHVS01065357.1~~GHVS01065357.1.p1  ORF type:complete len:178 (+),score=7.93 GHVS01065357.1:266-799(+)
MFQFHYTIFDKFTHIMVPRIDMVPHLMHSRVMSHCDATRAIVLDNYGYFSEVLSGFSFNASFSSFANSYTTTSPASNFSPLPSCFPSAARAWSAPASGVVSDSSVAPPLVKTRSGIMHRVSIRLQGQLDARNTEGSCSSPTPRSNAGENRLLDARITPGRICVTPTTGSTSGCATRS